MQRIFVNGVFDILHVGHVRLLRFAASLGAVTVGLNSDKSAKLLCKGDDRPLNDELSRREMLEALSYVDRVLIFDETAPTELLRDLFHQNIGPHIVIKGVEYAGSYMAEWQVLEANKCKIQYFTGPPFSTTGLVNKISAFAREECAQIADHYASGTMASRKARMIADEIRELNKSFEDRPKRRGAAL